MADKKGEMKLFEQMETDMKVGLDEVVNVFVSEYETNLHARKDELSKQIREEKADRKKFVESVELGVKGQGEKYETKVAVLGLASAIHSVRLDWKEKVGIVTVRITDTDAKDQRCADHMTKDFQIKLKANEIKRHTEFNEAIDRLEADLRTILGKIKDVSRKERQVRGEISRRKLQNAGMDALLNNEGMRKLISVDS